MKNKITVNKVALHLDVAVTTLNNWYKWYQDPQFEKPEDMPELPKYEQAYERAPRYWNKEDLPKLEKFQKWLPKGRNGIMGDYSIRYWGKRGEKILENRKKKENSK